MAIEELEQFIGTGRHLSRSGLENDLTLISPLPFFSKKLKDWKNIIPNFFKNKKFRMFKSISKLYYRKNSMFEQAWLEWETRTHSYRVQTSTFKKQKYRKARQRMSFSDLVYICRNWKGEHRMLLAGLSVSLTICLSVSFSCFLLPTQWT